MIYLLLLLPVAVALWAQMKVKSAYAEAAEVTARMSGAAAAREILHRTGIYEVEVQEEPGFLSDHYDSQQKVLRLSPQVFHGRSAAAVGIAAHEAAHAIQDAGRYLPLVVRSAAVPTASFGSSASLILLVLGAITGIPPLMWVGILIFVAVVFVQVVNLPVEFNASARAKAQLLELGIVNQHEMSHVRKVLDAAAMTYVAATLQAVFTLLHLILRFTGARR